MTIDRFKMLVQAVGDHIFTILKFMAALASLATIVGALYGIQIVSDNSQRLDRFGQKLEKYEILMDSLDDNYHQVRLSCILLESKIEAREQHLRFIENLVMDTKKVR